MECHCGLNKKAEVEKNEGKITSRSIGCDKIGEVYVYQCSNWKRTTGDQNKYAASSVINLKAIFKRAGMSGSRADDWCGTHSGQIDWPVIRICIVAAGRKEVVVGCWCRVVGVHANV